MRLAESQLTMSEAHELLAVPRRRHVLEVLTEQKATIGLTELATEVAGREGGATPTEESIQEIAVSLHHTHLPKISQLDCIDYDATAHEIDPAKIERALPPELLSS